MALSSRLCVSIALLLISGGAALAQPVPVLKAIAPDTLVPGENAITLAGDDIADAIHILFDDARGLTASIVRPAVSSDETSGRQSNDGGVRVQINVAPDAERGRREMRIATASGVSKPVTLYIDDHAAVAEKEPNNSISEAQRIELPGVIVGVIHAGLEADHYRFHAERGQRLIFDVHASRNGSKLDSSLALFDSGGNQIAHDEDTNGLDSLIDCTIPADGEYILRIQDLQYRGGGDFTYRIRAGALPYIDAIFPLGARRGGSVPVALLGRNLPASMVELWLDPKAPLGKRSLRPPPLPMAANAVSFEVSDLPDSVESEPNDSPEQASPTTLPVAINGRIDKPGDVDVYQFRSPTSRPVVFEVAAQRYGSPLDALLTLRDEAGNVLQHNDDAMGADARIELKDSRDKLYTIAITDLIGRGGEAFAYRLSIREVPPETPGFELVFPPDTPRVTRGGRTRLWCDVRRRGGFKEDVFVTLTDLPPGVTCPPIVLSEKNKSSGLLVISAGPDAPVGLHSIGVAATAKIDGIDVTREPNPKGYTTEPPPIYLSVLERPLFAVERVGPAEGDEDPKNVAAEISAINKILQTQTPELDAGLARWETEMARQPHWEPLVILSARSQGGASLIPQKDGSIVSDGRNPDRDVYTIVAATKTTGITGFKLEAIAAEGKGPGRARDGNFVLSRFHVTAHASFDEKQVIPVELHNPRADFSQSGFPIEETLKEKSDIGWAVHPQVASSHWALWDTNSPVGVEGGTTFTITLTHNWRGFDYNLRQFRIMITTEREPEGSFSLPDNILTILRIDPSRRNDQQKEVLAAHYRAIAPELQPYRNRLAQLDTSKAPFPPVIEPEKETTLAVTVNRMGFDGEITLSAEGFSAGIDGQTGEPNPINRNIETRPVILKAGQIHAAIPLKANGNAEKGTRTIIVRAEGKKDGHTWTEYSALVPLTVKEPPKEEEEKKSE